MDKLKIGLRHAYYGRKPAAQRFRLSLLAFDIATLVYFIVVSLLPPTPWLHMLELVIAAVILLDLLARFLIASDRRRYMLQLTTWADILVVVSLVAPLFTQNLVFLRVLRALRLLRSYHVLKDLRERWDFFKRNEEVIQSVINLSVFVFVVTALVYVLQARTNPSINTYIDALYFTVTTLTTTGFGDITLEGSSGRLLAVIIMVVGVALFLRLIQTIFRPQKVHYTCPDCGLSRHDPDAVHCKHCGRLLSIETAGD